MWIIEQRTEGEGRTILECSLALEVRAPSKRHDVTRQLIATGRPEIVVIVSVCQLNTVGGIGASDVYLISRYNFSYPCTFMGISKVIISIIIRRCDILPTTFIGGCSGPLDSPTGLRYVCIHPIESSSFQECKGEVLLIGIFFSHGTNLVLPQYGFHAETFAHVTTDEVMCVDAAVEVEVELPVLVIGEGRGGVVETISSVRAPWLV